MIRDTRILLVSNPANLVYSPEEYAMLLFLRAFQTVFSLLHHLRVFLFRKGTFFSYTKMAKELLGGHPQWPNNS